MLKKLMKKLWQTLTFLTVVPVMIPFALKKRTSDGSWVIGGHGGRARMDNAGVLHEYIVTHTTQKSIWITENQTIYEELRAQNHDVLMRGTLRARWALLIAPAVIYSHGEDDVEVFALFLRRLLGRRIYLNHCMNHLKAGEHYTPQAEELKGVRHWLFSFLVTDFDHLLACTEKEKENFALSYPGKEHLFQLGGGAHIDNWMQMRQLTQEKTIVYFATFRESKQAQTKLHQVIKAITENEELRNWLEKTGRNFVVITHINSTEHELSNVKITAPFRLALPNELISLAGHSEAFISDYSGIILDYVATKRPILLFPFDLDDYLQDRRLYVKYTDLDFGFHAQTVEELIALLVSERWKEPFTNPRARWEKLLFAHDGPGHVKDTYNAIQEIVEKAYK